MSRILITGAAGFVGKALCPALAAAGHELTLADQDWRAATPPVTGARLCAVPDIGPDTDWREALDGNDAVVHLAARVHVMDERAADPLAAFRHVNSEGTRRLAEEAAACKIRRLVFISTVKVNGEATAAEPFRAGDPAAPQDAYGLSKFEAERALFDTAERTGLEVVVLRPPLVYGPGVRGNFLSLLNLCHRAPPLPLAAIDNRRSLLYVGNLAAAVRACLDHPAAAGRVFLARDGEDVSTPALIRAVAAALGRPARLFPVPPPLLRVAGRVAGKSATVARLLDSLAVDDGEIRGDLDWKPPFTLTQGLQETAAWFTSRHHP